MALKAQRKSIIDEINSLLGERPKNFDSDDEAEETRAKVVEKFDESDSDVDVGLSSSIRKQNIDLLDEVDDRYKGKKVSRKDIYGSNSSNDDLEDDEDASESENDDNNEESQDEEEEEEEEDDDDDHNDGETLDSDESFSEDNEVDEDNPLYRNREKKSSFKSMTASNPRGDVEKGNCVRRQLKIWENLLEMRIQLQKCLITSNKMPQFDIHQELSSDQQFKKTENEAKNKLTELLENLLEVQDKLLKNNPETKNLFNKKQKEGEDNRHEAEEEDPMDEEICSDTEDEMEKNEEEIEEEQSEEPPKKKKMTLAEYEKILDENHKKYTPYRNSVIQKWNDKTRVASGKMSKGTSQPVVKQIEFIMSDKSKIVRRTQLKRSEYEVIGKKSKDEADEDGRRTQEYDPEIYDDDDFYHQLLRELIEHKSADITDPVQLSKQWIQLQNMRNKMKKKVDTKATKGRRIRYNVHNKLVNFMAPNTLNDTWSDQAKNELNSSMFSKRKVVDNNSKSVNGND